MNNNVKSYFPLWATYFAQDGYTMSGDRIMGRQAAGNAYLKAILKSDITNIGLYLKNQTESENAVKEIQNLLPKDKKIELERISYTRPELSNRYGGIFFPGPNLKNHLMARTYFGHEAYSCVGITHTTASHTVMTGIADLLVQPAKPWDAIICTSQVVLDTVNIILDNTFEFYKKSLGANKKELPMFPIIPLGVHDDDFNFDDEYKTDCRKSLGIENDDIVVVYVGRLSFHAKAHPVPMYLALEQCAKSYKNGKIHLIQTGWFANDFIEKSFKDDARKLCPSIKCHFLDGKIQEEKYKSLAAGDIFMSLSDNQQETFGLTPLEGMASGLPVIVSDWNGYRSTVRDGVDGFTIKSYSLSDGFGEELAFNHMIDFIDYNHYVGFTSQRVAIDIDICIEKLNILINNKDKRLEMGKNGRDRAQGDLSWVNIISKYKELATELNKIRDSYNPDSQKGLIKLPHDRMDPFKVFSTYPTEIINNKSLIKRNITINKIKLDDFFEYSSVNYAMNTLPKKDEFISILELLDHNQAISISDLEKKSEINNKDIIEILIVLLKYGYISVVSD